MSINYFDKESLDRWFKDNGDLTYRLNYDLNNNSTVFDLGGYVGDWSQQISDKYDCNIFIFEPVLSYYKEIEKRFSDNKKVKPFNSGLSPNDEYLEIYHNSASSSVFGTSGKSETICFKNIKKFIDDHKIKNIDLIKINIEGSEYDLLEYIIENNIQGIFKNIQVQFHKNIVPDWDSRRDNIIEKLKKSHNRTYNYEFVWENWEIKK
jgi:FkbM family methyltransferase